MRASFFSCSAALAGLLLAGLTALPASASTTTLTFDDLATEPGLAGDANPLSSANGGSSTVSGIVFNATNNDNGDGTFNLVNWEVIGNDYKAGGSVSPVNDFFGHSHSGDYYLAGDTYAGADSFGNNFSGLTISTTQALESLWIGADDNGFNGQPSPDATKLIITAYGAGGDLAAVKTVLNTPGLSFLDTSADFGSLSGVTGYRFETDSYSLYATQGQGYLLADDLTFMHNTPVPEASTTVSLGLLLALGLGGIVLAAKRKKTA